MDVITAQMLEDLLGYKQSFSPPPLPNNIQDLIHSYMRCVVDLHQVPVRTLATFLEVHDDLTWEVRRWSTHSDYYTAQLLTTGDQVGCDLTFYSLGIKDDDPVIPTRVMT